MLGATKFTTEADNPLVTNIICRLPALKLSDDELEVILDYKEIARNAVNDPVTMASQQILTYSWLRNRRAQREIVAAGAVVFVNDLLPDGADPNADPSPRELDALLNQAIEPIGVSGTLPEQAVRFFDTRVERIEAAQTEEDRPTSRTGLAADAREADLRRLRRRYHCPKSAVQRPAGVNGIFAPDAPWYPPAMLTDSQRRAAVVASRKNLGPETL